MMGGKTLLGHGRRGQRHVVCIGWERAVDFFCNMSRVYALFELSPAPADFVAGPLGLHAHGGDSVHKSVMGAQGEKEKGIKKGERNGRKLVE